MHAYAGSFSALPLCIMLRHDSLLILVANEYVFTRNYFHRNVVKPSTSIPNIFNYCLYPTVRTSRENFLHALYILHIKLSFLTTFLPHLSSTYPGLRQKHQHGCNLSLKFAPKCILTPYGGVNMHLQRCVFFSLVYSFNVAALALVLSVSQFLEQSGQTRKLQPLCNKQASCFSSVERIHSMCIGAVRGITVISSWPFFSKWKLHTSTC